MLWAVLSVTTITVIVLLHRPDYLSLQPKFDTCDLECRTIYGRNLKLQQVGFYEYGFCFSRLFNSSLLSFSHLIQEQQDGWMDG